MSFIAALIAVNLPLLPGEKVYAPLSHGRTEAILTNRRVVLRDKITKEGLSTLRFPASTTGVTMVVKDGQFRATAYVPNGIDDKVTTWILDGGIWRQVCELKFSQRGKFERFVQRDVTGDGVDDLLVNLRGDFDAIKNQLLILRWDPAHNSYRPVGRLMSQVKGNPFRVEVGKVVVRAPLFVMTSLPWEQWSEETLAEFSYEQEDDLFLLEKLSQGNLPIPLDEGQKGELKLFLERVVDRDGQGGGDCHSQPV